MAWGAQEKEQPADVETGEDTVVRGAVDESQDLERGLLEGLLSTCSHVSFIVAEDCSQHGLSVALAGTVSNPNFGRDAPGASGQHAPRH